MRAQKNRNIKIKLLQKKVLRKNNISSPFLPFVIAFLLIPNLTQAQLDFKHWQTFSQSEAFAPIEDWSGYLVYRYKAAKQSDRFSSKQKRYSTYDIFETPSYGEFNELGIFCTLDLRMDLKLRLPVRFRLGTLDAVNRKEGYYD